MIYSNNILKLYAAESIMESNLLKAEKYELMTCLKNSDLLSTIDFLNKGKFEVSENKEIETIAKTYLLNKKLLEDIDEYMFERFTVQKLNEISLSDNPDRFAILFKSPAKTLKTAAGSGTLKKIHNRITGTDTIDLTASVSDGTKMVGGAVIALLIIAFANHIFKKYISKTEKVCGKYKGKEKADCIAKLKINGYNEAIAKMKMLETKKCPTTKDPQKCKDKIEKAVLKYEKKIKDYKVNLRDN